MDLSHVLEPRLNLFHNTCDIIFDICRHSSNLEASKVAVLLWFLWQHRNEKVWNGTAITANQIGTQAFIYWQQWADVNGLLQAQQQRANQLTTDAIPLQWQQPPNGVLKCNTDASFYNIGGATGWGWVLRDYRGQFQLAGSNIVHSPLSVMEGEAIALLEAMEEVIHRGYSFVIFESDSKLVVDAITSKQVGVSEFCVVISRIQSLLRANNYFEVKYVKRQANKAAHVLARAAFSMSRRCIFDSVPRCIESYLINETS
jgi:ribonuclease HI